MTKPSEILIRQKVAQRALEQELVVPVDFAFVLEHTNHLADTSLFPPSVCVMRKLLHCHTVILPPVCSRI